MISMLGGEEGEVLSVSWPEAPPGYPLVQAGLAEGLAVFDAGVGENPVVGGEDLIRRGRHNARSGTDHAEQVGLGLVVLVKAALKALGALDARISPFLTFIVCSSSISTSQLRPLPPKYMSLPPRSRTHALTS